MGAENRHPQERKPKPDDAYGTFRSDNPRLKAFLIREIRIFLVWGMVLFVGGPVLVPRLLAILSKYGM